MLKTKVRFSTPPTTHKYRGQFGGLVVLLKNAIQMHKLSQNEEPIDAAADTLPPNTKKDETQNK